MRLRYLLPLLLVAAACNKQTASNISAQLSENLADGGSEGSKQNLCVTKNDCFDTMITTETFIVPPHAFKSPTFAKGDYYPTRKLIEEVGVDINDLKSSGFVHGEAWSSKSFPLGEDYPYQDLTLEKMDFIFKNNTDPLREKTYSAYKTAFFLSNLNLLKSKGDRLQGHDYVIQMRPEVYLKRYENLELVKKPGSEEGYCYSKAPGTVLVSSITLDKGTSVTNSREVRVGQSETKSDSSSNEKSREINGSVSVTGEVSAGFMGSGIKVGGGVTVGAAAGSKDMSSITNEIAKSTETGHAQTSTFNMNLQERYELHIVKDKTEYCLVKRNSYYKGIMVYKIRQIGLDGVDPIIKNLSEKYSPGRTYLNFFIRHSEVNGKNYSEFDPILFRNIPGQNYPGLYVDVLNKKVMDDFLVKMYPDLDPETDLAVKKYPTLEGEAFLRNEKGALIFKKVEITGMDPSISTAEKNEIDNKKLKSFLK